MAGAVRRCGGSRPWVIAGTAYGVIVGMWPDAADWIATQAGWYPEGELYRLYHFNPPWYWLYQIPFFLHDWLDKFAFHVHPGYPWWDHLGWLALTMWYVAGLLYWYAFRNVEERL